MRKIKFRVWDSEEYLSLSKALEKGFVGVQFDNEDCFELEPYFDNVVIEQFTGLKDKNGVEIYEGDKIKCLDSYGEEYYETEVSKCGMYVIEVQGCDYDFTSLIFAVENGDASEIKVIGNIHQTS